MTADGQSWEAALSIGGSGQNEKHHQQSRGKWHPTLGEKDPRQTHTYAYTGTYMYAYTHT